MALLRAPTLVFIALTYRCNLQCRHCAVYGPDTACNDLDTGTWLSFFRELADLKVLRLRLSGGEPFMRDDIWQLLDAVDALPMRWGINTNATRIDRHGARRLTGYRRLDDIMVSLDGDASGHDAMRGRGAFALARQGIAHLSAAGLPVLLYCTVTRCNRDHLEPVAELALEFKARSVKFNDLLPAGRGLANYRDLSLTQGQWRTALDTLRRLRETHGPLIAGTILDTGDQYDAIARHAAGKQAPGEANCLCGCGTLINQCAVQPDGRITPCDRLPDLAAGNIVERRFGELWRQSPGFATFRARRHLRLNELPECRDCLYTGWCTGGCPAVPYALNGKITARDPLQCYRLFSGEETADAI